MGAASPGLHPLMIGALDLVEKAVVLSFEVVTLFLQLGKINREDPHG